MVGNTTKVTVQKKRLDRPLVLEEPRATKKIDVEWLDTDRFIGEEMKIYNRRKLLAFINTEPPRKVEGNDEKLVITLSCRLFDGSDIWGKEVRLPLTFARDSLFAAIDDEEEDVVPVIKANRKLARQDLKDFIDKSMAKTNANPWLSQKKRCENLAKMFEKRFLDKKFEKALRAFALFEVLWDMTKQLDE